jgi:glycosyltransferase involved in cell wall biosynthesis
VRTLLYYTDGTTSGGAEQVLLTLLAGLDRRRWRPVLVYHPAPGLAPLLESVQQLDVRLRAVARVEGKQTLARMARFVWQLWSERPAVFHAHLNWPLACRHGLLAAAMARVPAVVASEHLFVEIPWRRSIMIQQLISRGVDRYIAVSHDLARRLRQTLRFPSRKVCVVHNGIPLAPFDRPASAALRTVLGGEVGRPLVLTLARMNEQKGHEYLLEAAALVPEGRFVLAGDGPCRVLLEAQARALDLDERVVFLGHRQDVPELLASCDLFVLPSLFEGLPLSILEAMATAKPVIATAVGGTAEAVLHGETGLLVPPADPAALAAAIRTVLSDPLLAQRLATAGRARVRQEFAAETMVQRVTDIYEEVLDSRGGRRGRR